MVVWRERPAGAATDAEPSSSAACAAISYRSGPWPLSAGAPQVGRPPSLDWPSRPEMRVHRHLRAMTCSRSPTSRETHRIRAVWYARRRSRLSTSKRGSGIQTQRIFTRIILCQGKRVDARLYCFARSRPYVLLRMPEDSILIVEDNEDFRGLVRAALEQEGFTVREACDGQEALARLRESGNSRCLMVMDLMMPGMTGWELVSAVRSDP